MPIVDAARFEGDVSHNDSFETQHIKVAGAGEEFAGALMMLILLVVLPGTYASFYVSYRDIFVTIDDDV